MPEVEVFLDWDGSCRLIGSLYRQVVRGRETVSFQYDLDWIDAKDSFAIDPIPF
jgi:hypothetical protein